MVIIHAGRGPGGHGPLPALRVGQDAVVLAQLIQGGRGHLAHHGPVLLGAVEGGEVHRAGQDLIRVALGDAVQESAVEVHPEGVVFILEVVGLAKGPLNLADQGQHGAASLAVLQDDTGLPTVADLLHAGVVLKLGAVVYGEAFYELGLALAFQVVQGPGDGDRGFVFQL